MRCAHGLNNPISLGGREVSSQFINAPRMPAMPVYENYFSSYWNTPETIVAGNRPDARNMRGRGQCEHTLPFSSFYDRLAPALSWRLIREHGLERTTRVAMQRRSSIVPFLSHQSRSIRLVRNDNRSWLTGYERRSDTVAAGWMVRTCTVRMRFE